MEPPLNGGAEPVFAAFLELSPSRQMGFGEGAIPLTEIQAYMDLFGHPGCDDPREFVTLIRACDAAFLEARAEKK